MQNINRQCLNSDTILSNLLKLVALLTIIFNVNHSSAQQKASTDSIFYEDFENGLDKWTQKHVGNPTRDWYTRMGGAKPLNGTVNKPDTAQHGDFNAYFYISSVQYTYSTYLISPVINFSEAHKPLLTFWYSLYESQMGDPNNPEELITDNFEFTLCYRLTPTSEWVEYRDYKNATNDVTPWRCDSIYLPEELCGNSQVQIAFLGKTKSIGLGICIDNVKIKETLVINKYVTSIYALQPNTNMIPTSSTDNPLMMLRIPVLGNNGKLFLNSITATALEQASQSIPENGMKLFYTQSEEFRTNNLLATASITNGKAKFSNINFDLPLGNAYLWIACDIKDEDGEHRLKNNIIDIKIEPNAINIGEATYPSDELSPSGERIVNESIFFDDFEDETMTNNNWTFTGEFEHAEVQGKGGGNGGNPDPDYARSGYHIIGTDITGQGTEGNSFGNYEKNIGSRAYTATTNIFNGYYYKDINILFYRWLNCNTGDSAFVSYSLNGGSTWTDAWRTTAIMQESSWSFQKLNISKFADRNDSINLQVSLGPTPSQLQYSGWNIDDFALVGTFVYADAAIESIIAPNDGCGLSDSEDIIIKIKNAGYNDIEIPFNVSYSIDDGDWVEETITTGMTRDEVMEYTFQTKADLSGFGEHTIKTKVTLDEDEYSPNNNKQKTILSLPHISLPYSEDFNSNHGYWYGYGENKTWEYGAVSGVRCWATKLASNYPAGDSAWLESPCFNLSNIQKPMLSFKLKADAADTDGLSVYYSTDNGSSWILIPYGTSYSRLSWYNTNTNIDALGTKGWSGVFDWTLIQQLLPDELAGENSVKLRFLFQSAESEGATGHNGFAINDIKLYEAPIDAGISEIAEPTTSCYLLKEQPVKVKIKNFGIRGITSADSLFATITINNTTTLTDTFFIANNDTIAPGNDAVFEFSQTANMWSKRDYKMTAYTNLTGDTLLFNSTNNDTAKAIASVKGEPAYTLGPDIGTLNPNNIVIFGGKSMPDSSWFTSYDWKPWKDSDGIMIAEDSVLYPTSTQRWIGVREKLPDFPVGKEKGYYYEYTITVTNAEGCNAYDTIRIIKSETNIGIEKISFNFDYPEDGSENPQEFTRAVSDKPGFGNTQYCISKQPENITVTVKNEAGVEVSANERISLCYSYFDADTNTYTYSEDTVLAADMLAGESFEYTFKQAPELALGIVQDLHFFVRINADMNHKNDSATIKVNAWPLPIAEIRLDGNASDSIPVSNPANKLLTTKKIDNASYLWQDGLTTSISYEIPDTSTNTAYYWITVSDEHSCGTATDSVLIFSDNWRIDSIITPIDQCETTDEAELTVSITNLSSVNNYPAGYTIPAIATVNGESFRENIVLSSSLKPDSSFIYTFSMPVNMSEAKTYSISVRIVPTHDINRNDNITYKDVNIWGIRQVDLGAAYIYTLEADTIELDAGEGFMSYHWSTDGNHEETAELTSTERTFAITSNLSETYKVSVEDFHGCPSSEDEVTIMPFDLSITEISSPKTSCNLNSVTTAELKIHNNGKSEIYEGTIIYIYVQTDSGTVFEQEQELPEIAIGQSQIISFHYTPTFAENSSEHTVKMWLSWENDHFYHNDTLSQTIIQYPSPEAFDLGSDIYTTRPDTVQLTAPDGYHDYIWSNDSTGSNILDIKYTGSAKYWVRITNGYGCSTSDSISIISTDLTMNILNGAYNSCSPVNSDSVTAQIEVNRYNSIPAGAQFTVSYECNGYNSTKEITTDKEITFNDPYIFNFDTPVTLSDTGNYTLKTKLVAHNSIDIDTVNNNTTSIVRIGALQLPFEDTVRTYDDMYIIDAGSSFSTFNWIDNPLAEQRIAVVSSGTYTLTAVDTNGCQTTDSTYILFVVPNYDICGLGFTSTMCTPSEPTDISFYLKNTGNDIIAANTSIPISYKIAENETVNEQFAFTNNLNAGDSVLITFATQTDLRDANDHYSLLLTASVGNFNASAVKTLTIMPNPEPDLGDDVTTAKDSWQLTPGINYGSLLWNTGSTEYYIDVTETGEYWVTATNNYGCSASDTVSVFFIQPTISISAFNSETSSCGDLTDAFFNIDITNDGEKDISEDKHLGLKCSIDDTTIIENIDLKTTFSIGSTLTYTMQKAISVIGVGTHNISFAIDINGTPADSAEYQISIFDFPTFNFENDELVVNEYPYTLEAPVNAASYLWGDGSTGNSISVTADGDYSLSITDDNNCTASGSIRIKLKKQTQPEDTTSIHSIAEGEIGVYPNPANNQINIDFSKCQMSNCQIWIANVAGQVMLTDNQTSDIMNIDISNWAQGVYIIKISNGNAIGFVRFIKE